jgi:hypothetical protein
VLGDESPPLDPEEDEDVVVVGGSPLVELDVATSEPVVDSVLSALDSLLLPVLASAVLSVSGDPDDELVDGSTGSGAPLIDAELALGSSDALVLDAEVSPEDPVDPSVSDPWGGSYPHPTTHAHTTIDRRTADEIHQSFIDPRRPHRGPPIRGERWVLNPRPLVPQTSALTS